MPPPARAGLLGTTSRAGSAPPIKRRLPNNEVKLTRSALLPKPRPLQLTSVLGGPSHVAP